MQLRTADQAVGQAKPDVEVAVLKKTLGGMKHEIQRQHLSRNTQQDERGRVA